MTTENAERKAQGDALYEHYARPLEADRRGEYVAIFPGGGTVLGSTVVEVLQRASEPFGPGSFVFKIGEKAVGRC